MDSGKVPFHPFQIVSAERTQVTTKTSGKTSSAAPSDSAASTTATTGDNQTPAPTWINDIFQVDKIDPLFRSHLHQYFN